MTSAAVSAAAIDRYLETGEYDLLFREWPGGSFFDRAERGSAALQAALIEKVRRVASGVTERESQNPEMDLTGFTWRKVETMVRGLFSCNGAEVVITLLQESAVFLTRVFSKQIRTTNTNLSRNRSRHFAGFSRCRGAN